MTVVLIVSAAWVALAVLVCLLGRAAKVGDEQELDFGHPIVAARTSERAPAAVRAPRADEAVHAQGVAVREPARVANARAVAMARRRAGHVP